MDWNEFRAQLVQLRQDLESVEPTDERTREIIPALKHDIEQVLLKPADSISEEHQELGQRLRQAVLEFDASHPTLAAGMDNVIDILVKLGI